MLSELWRHGQRSVAREAWPIVRLASSVQLYYAVRKHHETYSSPEERLHSGANEILFGLYGYYNNYVASRHHQLLYVRCSISTEGRPGIARGPSERRGTVWLSHR